MPETETAAAPSWWRRGGVLVVLTLLVLAAALVAQVALDIEIDAIHLVLGVAIPLVGAVWQFASSVARDRWQHEAQIRTDLARRQADTQRELLMGPVSQVFHQVVELLGELAVAPDATATQRSDRLRRATQILYEASVYVHDPVLIDDIVGALEAAVRGEPSRLVDSADRIAARFRRELVGLAATDDVSMTTALVRMNRAILGLDRGAGIVPFKISQRTPAADWFDVRFAARVPQSELVQATIQSLPAGYFESIRSGDVLVFWRDGWGSRHDGVIGVAWVEKAETRGTGVELVLGRRRTVPRRRLVAFHNIDDVGLLDADGSQEEHDEGSAEVARRSEFERALRRGERVPAAHVTYGMTLGLAEVLQRLEDRREALPHGAARTVPSVLRNRGHGGLELLLDINALLQDGVAERLLEELMELVGSGQGLVVAYENTDYEVRSVRPRVVQSTDPFESPRNPTGHAALDRAFAVITLAPSAQRGPAREEGWRARADAVFSMTPNGIEITLRKRSFR